MRSVVMRSPHEVRVEQRPDPAITEPTDAVIDVLASCICGSDLWPYRGDDALPWPAVMGHEYVGRVREIGADVATLAVGDVVVGSFFSSDNTCDLCRAGYQSYCVHRTQAAVNGAQSDATRIPLADGTLVAVGAEPDARQLPGLLAASDVLGTGWFAAVSAEAGEGKTVAVIGDGAVGLLAILAARQLGAERVIVSSRHPARQVLAERFGATHILRERGDDAVAAVRRLTGGLGADSVIEAVGTDESMHQAIGCTRPGGHLGFVGAMHEVTLTGEELFTGGIHIAGGLAPVRRFLPDLIASIMADRIDPGAVFDLTLPLDDAATGYRAMDARKAVKVMLRP